MSTRMDREQARRRETTNLRAVETPEQQIARLNKEIDALEKQRDELNEQITTKLDELDLLQPAFYVGDVVKNKRGAKMVVLAVDRAFDSWVIKTKFPNAKDTEEFAYMADDLELVEAK